MLTTETIGSMIPDVRVLMRDVTSELNPTPHYSDDTICTGLVEGFRRGRAEKGGQLLKTESETTWLAL